MTTSAVARSISYSENGATVAFAVPFKFIVNTDVKALRRDATGAETVLTYGTQYSVTGAGSPSGGTLTTVAAAASGVTLVIYSETARGQTVDYATGDTFPAESHEGALDRLDLVTQEIDVEISRTVKVPHGENGLALPLAGLRASMFPVFDADGNLGLSQGTGADAGLRLDLADAGGAALVHSSSGGTVQDELNAIPGLIAASVIPPTAARAVQIDFGGPTAARQGVTGNILNELVNYTRTGGLSVIDFNGSLHSYAAGQVPINNYALWISPPETNYLLRSDEPSNAAWGVKTNLGTIVAADGPYGAGTAEFVPETVTNGQHLLGQNCSVPSGVDFLAYALIKGVGRDYVDLQLYVGSTAYGVACRFHLSGEGSIASGFPAELGSGGNVTNEAGGIKRFGDYYLIWASGLMIGAQTSMRNYIRFLQDATTVSYAGDITKGYNVAQAGVITGRVPIMPIPTVAASVANDAAFDLPVSAGYYMTQVTDEVRETLSVITVATDADKLSVLPSSGAFSVRDIQAIELAAYDAFDRADTAEGTLGTATDGGTYSLLAWSGTGAVMETSATGRVEDNRFMLTPAAGKPGTVYVVRDIGEALAVKHASCIVRFIDPVGGPGVISNTTAALLLSQSLDELIGYMPVHFVATRGGLSLQYRDESGFVTVGEFAAPTAYARNVDYLLSFAIFGDVVVVSYAGKELVIRNAIFATACRYCCWEIQTTSDNTTGDATIREFTAALGPVGYPPAYIPASPINDELPFASGTPVAGNLYSVASTRGKWRSNVGVISYAYQWQFNGADVPGATGITFQTTNGVDEGKTVSVRVIATNAVGTSSATSPPSAALT